MVSVFLAEFLHLLIMWLEGKGSPTPHKSSTFDDPRPRKKCQNETISHQFMIFKRNSRKILPWWWNFWVTIRYGSSFFIEGRQLLFEEGLRQLHVLQPEVLWQNSFREVIGFKNTVRLDRLMGRYLSGVFFFITDRMLKRLIIRIDPEDVRYIVLYTSENIQMVRYVHNIDMNNDN